MHVRDVCMVCTDIMNKSPKKFRFTLGQQVPNLSFEVLELLLRANEIYLGKSVSLEDFEKRMEYQREALISLRILAYELQLALEMDCILMKQYEYSSKLIVNCIDSLQLWRKSDRRRFNEFNRVLAVSD